MPRDDAYRARRSLGSLSLANTRFRADWLVVIALAAWTAAPLALQLGHIVAHGGPFTGGVSFDPPDLFQYLWWVRDSGTHLLISDPFQLVGTSQQVFFDPMFVVSGMLWRLGLSLSLAYFIPWAPVAVLLTFVGFRAYVHRHISTKGGAAAALILSLFYFTPIGYLAYRTGHLWGGIQLTDVDATNAFSLWGYFPRAVAVALVPILLLHIERSLARRSESSATRSLRPLLVAGLLGLAIAWMHPWQGVEVVLVSLGFIAWSRPSPRVAARLLAPVIGAALPLAYYIALQHYDFFWRASAAQLTRSWVFSPEVLVVAVLPLLLLALAGMRRKVAVDAHRRLLLLWLVAAVIGYFAIPSQATHSLDGALLPLSILAVQGWQRLASGLRERRGGRGRARRTRISVAVAVVAVGLCTIPGALKWVDVLHQSEPYQRMASDDLRAFRFLERVPGPGGVLASADIAYAVPAYTGRNTFNADFPWTPNFAQTSAVNMQLYGGQFTAKRSQLFVRTIGPRFVLVDCRQRTPLPRLVSPLITAMHRFGCATVYEIKPSKL